MSNDGNSNSGSHIGLGGIFVVLLTVAFIVLKLCHVIEWSWIWVLSPLWIGTALYVLILIVGITLIIIGRS